MPLLQRTLNLIISSNPPDLTLQVETIIVPHFTNEKLRLEKERQVLSQEAAVMV